MRKDWGLRIADWGLARCALFAAVLTLGAGVAANGAEPAQEPVQESANQAVSLETVTDGVVAAPAEWLAPEGVGSSLKMVVLVSVLSLAPAILLMTTSFVRIVVVLGLLRQALGAQQLPSTQVVTSLALFLTFLLMAPVWRDSYEEGIQPYSAGELSMQDAWTATVQPIRKFMSRQIERTGNSEDIWLFQRYAVNSTEPQTYDDVPLEVLLPAYLLSELKTAFLIGFQIYLPFLIVDMVVSSVMLSMGMLMVPPMIVSLPLKLLLFVLVDGWHLVVGMLLDSFAAYG